MLVLMIQSSTDSAGGDVEVKGLEIKENSEKNVYLYCQQDWWQVGPGADALLGSHVTCDYLHSVDICSLDSNIVAGLVPFSSFHVFLQVTCSHFHVLRSIVAFFCWDSSLVCVLWCHSVSSMDPVDSPLSDRPVVHSGNINDHLVYHS